MNEKKSKNKKTTILIVDDDMQMRFYLMTLVKSMGYEPILTKDGSKGLEKLKEITPHGIILDIMMPDKGGAQVYKELVSNPEYQKIPVVFFSGVDKDSFFHYIKMLNINVDHNIPEPQFYVAKDADPEYLKEVVIKSLKK